MAFVTRDSTILSEGASIPPSFLATNDEDPFRSRGQSSESIPDARRNILEDINNAENTALPPPPQKENIEVYLRVKPRTDEELELVRENSGNAKDIPTEIVKIQSNYQVALNAPKESNAFKNAVNNGGTSKMTHNFTFTHVFKPDTDQGQIFSAIVCPKVKDFLEGQNQLLFTYGATSSGKTFTLQGVPGNSGIMPRAIDTIFSSIQAKCSTVNLQPTGFSGVMEVTTGDLEQQAKEKLDIFKLGKDLLGGKGQGGRVSPDLSCVSSTSSTASSVVTNSGEILDMSQLYTLFPGLQGRDRDSTKLTIKDSNIHYSVWVSFAEIYNENIHDLLTKVGTSKKKGEKVKRQTLKLCDDKSGSVYIKGLREVQVSSADEAYQILMIGRENLQFAATRLNQHSSRSHCIFTVKLVRVADPKSPHMARVSMLSFCDLAGSERISKTNNVGERQKEAGNINASLSVLGRVIKAIRHNQAQKDPKKKQIVPFRESKLTRLFQSYFTGLGKSSLIICISQAQYLFDESIHVCKFASIANKVTVETLKEAQPKKVAKKSSRFSSMIDKGRSRLLSVGGNSILGGRGSIAWEAPPGGSFLRRSSAIPASFNPNARSTIVGGAPPRLSTLINISEMEEGGDADETVPEGNTMDNTVVQTQYEQLLGLVEDLKQKLIQERKKNQNLEKNIREELCEEFNSMLVEVESGWERRLQAEKEDAERMSEWRVGELQSVHRNRNKRRRENDSGEFQNEIDLHRLQSQLETKEKEVAELVAEKEETQQQLQVMKDTTIKSKQEQDRLQMANSRLQFELSEQQRKATEVGRELEATKARLDEEERRKITGIDEDRTDLIMATNTVSSLRVELESKDEEIHDLRELINEAGDEFALKEEELKELQKVVLDRDDQTTQQGIVIQDLQAQLEESHQLLQVVNGQLEDSEMKVEELEQELERIEKEDVKDIKETVVKLRKQVGELEGELRLVKEKCSASEEFNVELKETLETAEKVAEEERENAKEAEEKMLEAQGERNQLLAVKSKLLEQLAEIKEGKTSQSQELEVSIECFDLKQQVDNLTETINKLTEANESTKRINCEQKTEIERLNMMNTELRSATNVDESMIDDEETEQLKAQVKDLIKEKELTDVVIQSSKEEVENLKKQLVSKEMVEVKDLKKEHARKVFEMSKEIEEQEVKLVEQAAVKEKVKDLEEQLEASEKLMEDLIEANDQEKIGMEAKLQKSKAEVEQVKAEMQNSESNLQNELKELEAAHLAALAKKEKRILEKEKELAELASKSSKSVDENSDSSTIVKSESEYIKELEDIIVDKEFKISELESARDETDGELQTNAAEKFKELEETNSKLESKLKEAIEQEKELKIHIEKLTADAAENVERLAHQDKMKQQRDDLEKRVAEFGKAAKQLAQVEDELRESKEANKIQEGSLSKAVEDGAKLKAELNEARGEVKVLKMAAKTGAKDAQEVHETKAKNDDLTKEIDRLKAVASASSRENDALGVLKSELEHKSKEIALVQEKVEVLRSELGAKDKEVSLLSEKVEVLQTNIEAKEYDLAKTKEERDKLMDHYDKIFKKKQEEIDSMKALEREKGSLGEIFSKATPSKQTGELKLKLAKTENEVTELKEKLLKEEDVVLELKSELNNLQKQMDSKTAQHEREVNRTKLANQKVIAEYKETNKELMRRVEVVVTSPDRHDTTSPTLEADDSKTDASMIEGTPVVKKGKGRGRGKGNRSNRSTASLASCEESTNENDPDVGRPRTASVSRKARVTRKGSKSDLSVDENDRSVSRKRPVSSRSEGNVSNVLREKQSFMLSPVPEGEKSGASSTDVSMAMTPAVKKKRKLCSMTPQHSEVFTPPTDMEQSTPGSVVKRQLRTRRQSKR